jgi:hypothetical protein
MTVAAIPKTKPDVAKINKQGKADPKSLHAHKHSEGGQVNFIAEAPITIYFDNSEVFGTDHYDLNTGDNVHDVQVDKGRTGYGPTQDRTQPNEVVVP